MESTIFIKVSLNIKGKEEVKKISIGKSYDALIDTIKHCFNLTNEDFETIKCYYIDDDEDPVTISGQNDLEMALEFIEKEKINNPSFNFKLLLRQKEEMSIYQKSIINDKSLNKDPIEQLEVHNTTPSHHDINNIFESCQEIKIEEDNQYNNEMNIEQRSLFQKQLLEEIKLLREIEKEENSKNKSKLIDKIKKNINPQRDVQEFTIHKENDIELISSKVSIDYKKFNKNYGIFKTLIQKNLQSEINKEVENLRSSINESMTKLLTKELDLLHSSLGLENMNYSSNSNKDVIQSKPIFFANNNILDKFNIELEETSTTVEVNSGFNTISFNVKFINKENAQLNLLSNIKLFAYATLLNNKEYFEITPNNDCIVAPGEKFTCRCTSKSLENVWSQLSNKFSNNFYFNVSFMTQNQLLKSQRQELSKSLTVNILIKKQISKEEYSKLLNALKNDYDLRNFDDQKILSCLEKAQGDVESALSFLFDS